MEKEVNTHLTQNDLIMISVFHLNPLAVIIRNMIDEVDDELEIQPIDSEREAFIRGRKEALKEVRDLMALLKE